VPKVLSRVPLELYRKRRMSKAVPIDVAPITTIRPSYKYNG
jgi:hypothetical protein